MQELVILDLDGVIINGQSQQIFLDYLFNKKLVSLFFYLKIYCWFILYKLGLVKSPKKMMNFAFSHFDGRKIDEVSGIVDKFFSGKLSEFIFPEIIDIINEHKVQGRELVIISNSAEIIVGKVSNFLGIKNYIGTQLETVGGKFTGKIEGEIVYGKNKLVVATEFVQKNNLNLNNSWSYADNISDLDLLMSVSKPYAVNPDRFLLSEAQKRNWPILKFKNILKNK